MLFPVRAGLSAFCGSDRFKFQILPCVKISFQSVCPRRIIIKKKSRVLAFFKMNFFRDPLKSSLFFLACRHQEPSNNDSHFSPASLSLRLSPNYLSKAECMIAQWNKIFLSAFNTLIILFNHSLTLPFYSHRKYYIVSHWNLTLKNMPVVLLCV